MDRVADRVAGLQWNASEAGGGDGEGFELAGHDLVRNASHDDGAGFPGLDAFAPEHESDRSPSEHGEADETAPPDLYAATGRRAPLFGLLSLAVKPRLSECHSSVDVRAEVTP